MSAIFTFCPSRSTLRRDDDSLRYFSDFHPPVVRPGSLLLRELKRFGLLRGMGVLGVAIDLQLFPHGATEFARGQHALDRFFHQELWTAHNALIERLFLETARESGVVAIDLLLRLCAGELHFRSVDDDDVVARVKERRVTRVMLAA